MQEATKTAIEKFIHELKLLNPGEVETIEILNAVVDEMHDAFLPRSGKRDDDTPAGFVYAGIVGNGKKLEDEEGVIGMLAKGKCMGWGSSGTLNVLKRAVDEKVMPKRDKEDELFEQLAQVIRAAANHFPKDPASSPDAARKKAEPDIENPKTEMQ